MSGTEAEPDTTLLVDELGAMIDAAREQLVSHCHFASYIQAAQI
jgi:hypothetical protein